MYIIHPTGLSCEEREWLQDLEKANFDDGMDVDPNVWPSMPPGEEGALFSNAGGEEELCRALLAEDVNSRYVYRMFPD